MQLFLKDKKMFYTLSNDVIINIDQIATITKPIKKDPYNKIYGEEYDIVMSSGCVHHCYDSVTAPKNMSINLMGAAILQHKVLMELLKMTF